MASPPLFLYIGGLQMKFEDLKLKLVSLVRNRIGQLFAARSPHARAGGGRPVVESGAA